MTTLVVLQPGYLPWLGFFDQVDRSDIFVYYDDVQFDKNGWRNRNRIKSTSGIQWLSVPVLQSGRFHQRNNEVEIDNRQDWRRKHIMSMRQSYARAPFLKEYLPSIEATLMQPWRFLADLDIALSSLLAVQLGVASQIHRMSELGITGERNGRLVALCRHFGVDEYLSGDAARSYLKPQAFEEIGVRVEWQTYNHPSYRQLHGSFEPYLSVIDLLFNEGAASLEILRSGSPKSGTFPTTTAAL